MKNIFLAIIFLLYIKVVNCQQKKTDSLNALVAAEKDDLKNCCY
ncbi:MAG: hypothetical protein U0V03_11135 [Bacteroidia bacterium]